MKKLKSNIYVLSVAKFLLFIGVFYVIFHSSVSGVIFPFTFGLMYALVWANQKIWLVVPAYITSGAIFCPTLEFSICLLASSFAIVLPYFVHVLCKRVIKKWEFACFAIVGQSANVTFSLLLGMHPVLPFVSTLLGVLFMYACMVIFEAFVIRGFSNKLTSVEVVSLFSLIAVVCGGLSALNIGAFSFLKFFVCLLTLIFAFCATHTLTLLVSSIAGVGALISTNSPIFMAPFLIWALCALLFKNHLRIFMVIAILCVEVVNVFYFRFYQNLSYLQFLSSALACIIFMCLPKSWCNEISVVFNLSKDRMAMKNVVNRNREILQKRLGNLSEIFNDMNLIYRHMLKKSMSLEEIKNVLNQEIVEKVCAFCPERAHCHRVHAENTKKVFDSLVTIAYEKGRATLLDIPSFLTSRCKQTNAILSGVNSLTEQYRKFSEMVKDVDTSKLVLAEQLLGVSKIMASLSQEMETKVSFDSVRENKILDELMYYNIICIDVVVFQKDVWTMEVSLVVKNEDAQKERIIDVVSKICGQKMAIYEDFSSARPGYRVLSLKTAPKFDCLFGVSQRTKNGSRESGDCYSVVKLSGDKIMFAINDGMGSGQEAKNASEMSISLIENFYRAGFDNDLILATTNKLLSLHQDDIFSALDICIFDQKDGLLDFIKMASPNSYILSESECKKVETGSLPIGIIDETKPLVKKFVLQANDFVVLFSDGVSDSFENEQEFEDCVKAIKTKNPQEFADELLENALAQNNGYAVDDMSVLVIKVLKY